jgi:proline racemase
MALKRMRNLLYVIDTHTEGEPTRIVVAGFPRLEGFTLLEKRRFMAERLDHLRTALLLEPRGHDDQFGALVLPTERADADYALLFMDAGGYLDMCGHGIMGVTTALIETGMIEPQEPKTIIKYETLAGVVSVSACVVDGSVTEVTLVDVPSFYLGSYDVSVGGTSITVDVAYGGNFYVIAEAEALGTRVRSKHITELIKKGIMLRDEARRQIAVHYPDHGVSREIQLAMITDEPELPYSSGKNIVVFGRGQFDRSPCGTGTAARLSVMYSKGVIKPGDEFIHESIINTTYRAKIVETTRIGPYEAIVPEITGRAFITQVATVIIDSEDPLWRGFSVAPHTSKRGASVSLRKRYQHRNYRSKR